MSRPDPTAPQAAMKPLIAMEPDIIALDALANILQSLATSESRIESATVYFVGNQVESVATSLRGHWRDTIDEVRSVAAEGGAHVPA